MCFLPLLWTLSLSLRWPLCFKYLDMKGTEKKKKKERKRKEKIYMYIYIMSKYRSYFLWFMIYIFYDHKP